MAIVLLSERYLEANGLTQFVYRFETEDDAIKIRDVCEGTTAHLKMGFDIENFEYDIIGFAIVTTDSVSDLVMLRLAL